MSPLLLLHDSPADLQTSRAVECISIKLASAFQIVAKSIGPGASYRSALSAAWSLRSAARAFAFVHAFGPKSLAAAIMAPFKRIVYTPAAFPSRRQIAWLRAILAHRDLHIISPSTTMHRALVSRGLPASRCHLIRPGVDFARVRARRDPALRAALGFDDSQQVILVAGESIQAAAHDQAVWAGTILNCLDHRTRLLLWGKGPRAAAAARFAQQLAQPELVTRAAQRLRRPIEFEDLLPAADAIWVSATGPIPTLPIAICMAAALPIIATVTPTVAELLEDRHTSLMTQPSIPRLLARRTLDLREDRQLQWALADMARTEAYEFFPQTRFVAQHRSLYEQMSAGGEVRIEQPAPGVGSRFHGRG